MTGLAAALTTLLALGLVAVLAGVFVYNAPGPAAPKGAVTTVVLRHGEGLAEISGDLERARVIRSAALFAASVELTRAGRRLKAGEYAFPSRGSMARVLKRLTSGDIVRHKVTIAEGLTSAQAVALLDASDILTGLTPTPPEGALLPETYEVTRGEPRAAVLQRMMDARDRVVSELWVRRRTGLPITTPDEAVTLASIVEKETALPAERPRVAAVYENRLHIGMRLQADPTIIYGITGGAPLGRGIRASELAAATPYNTYVNAGLPPGPIGNPGRASLAAVLDPPRTDELYFVADGTGGHVFARTDAEQEVNVAHWREIERQRAQNQASTSALPKAKEHR